MQLIFIVEANKDCRSDFLYISETLRKYYNTLGHKITPIYLDGKGNYNKNKIKQEININIHKYSGITNVFMCYDIDNLNKPSFNLNKLIENFCNDNGYHLIWFYEDIEEVYIGKHITNNDKKKKAEQFVSHNLIKDVEEISLNQTNISRNK